MKKVARLLIVLLSLTFLGGCALIAAGVVGTAAGVTGYKYLEGKLERQYPIELKKAWEVTNTALANLQVSITGSLLEYAKGDIEGVKKDGKKIYVSLKDSGHNVTSISIRVGVLGDRDEAARIHDEIAAVAGF